MVKKTKTAQQRSKEEQWRKRMATQGRSPVGTAVADDLASDSSVTSDQVMTFVPAGLERNTPMARASAPAQKGASAVAKRATVSQSPTAQRRVAAASRTGRSRGAVNALTVEEEMYYVRTDIRRLIILTAICFAIIVLLAFIIP